MKTSKRLLSLFLALVMVVTTCSVGFAAFAADSEDDVFTYVTDEGEAAEITVDGLTSLLNTYAPALIELLRDTLEGIGVDVDAVVAADEPIKALLGQLSPTLIETLGGSLSGDMESVVGSSAFNNLKYAYLEDEDADMDFWSLYAFCQQYSASDDADVASACSEALEALDALLALYDEGEERLSAAEAKIEEVLGTGLSTFYTYSVVVMNYMEDDAYYQQLVSDFNALCTVFGGAATGLPASLENIGNVICTGADNITLSDFAAEVEANGNVYDGVDFNTFINYVSIYARAYGAIEEDETLTLIGAIYYYYNQQITSTEYMGYLAALSVLEDGETLTYEQDLESALGISSETLLGLGFDPDNFTLVYTVTLDSDTYFVDAFKDAYSLEEYMNYADFFCYYFSGGVSRMSISSEYEELWESVYDCLYIAPVRFFFNVPSGIGSLDVNSDEFSAMVDYILTEGQIVDDVAALREAYQLTGADDSDWEELYNLLFVENSVDTSDYSTAISLIHSSSLSNEVIKYMASRTTITTGLLSSLRAWTPGTEITSTSMITFADTINSSFNTYAVKCLLKGNAYGDTTGNNNFSDQLAELFTIQAVVESITDGYDWDDYAELLTGDVGISVVNSLLNAMVSTYLDPNSGTTVGDLNIGSIVNTVLDTLLETSIDLTSVLTDVYKNLAEDPVGTIFGLLPILMVLLDELIFPLVFNAPASGDLEADLYYDESGGFLYPLLASSSGILGSYTQSSGDLSVGLGQLRWDLNTLVPTLLHWLIGDNDYTYTYYNITDIDEEAQTGTYGETVTGAYGTKYDANGDLNVDENGERRVPVIFNIYYVDSALADVAISDLADDGEDTSAAISEVVEELASFALEAIETYVSEHSDDVSSYSGTQPVQKGLNNLLVALPMIINELGQQFIEKYGIDSDWSFGDIQYTDDGCVYNATLDEFKSFATGGDTADILNDFVDIFINNWLNALIDLLNDLISDEDNAITSEIPVITGLLNAMDLFGETSVLTDVLNGMFLMTRESEDSFTFETRENGYVGLSTLSAYFLLTNLDTIIDVVTNIVDANSSDDDTSDDTTADDTTSDTADDDSSSDSSSSSFDISSILTPLINALNNANDVVSDSENLEGASSLIGTLDSLLSSLLSNAYLNGYQLDEVDGVLSGIVTTLTNVFGENQADEVWYLITEYLKVLNAGSANEDGSANKDANGTVDADAVYTTENLSNIVTQTYVLLENLVDDNIVVAGDEYKLINSAVNGLFSPNAIYIHAQDNIDSNVASYLTWADVAESRYATDLGYSFSDGDKEGFYNALIDSLGVIPAILGVLLVDANLYNDVLAPLFAEICGAMGVSYTTSLSADATGEDAIYAIIETVSNVLQSFLDAPLSGLLGLVRGLIAGLDDSVLGAGLQLVIDTIQSEFDGICAIVENLSPTLAAILESNLDSIMTTIRSTIPTSNILFTIIDAIAGTSIASMQGVILSLLSPYLGSNEELLLLVYAVLVDLLTDESIFSMLFGDSIDDWIVELITSFDSASLLHLIKELVSSIQSTKELEWIYNSNTSSSSSSFTYPTGITAQDAEDAVDSLDDLVTNLISLLNEFGVIDEDSLSDLINGLIFTNSNITAIATGVYGAIEDAAGDTFSFTPAQFAEYLTDSSYGSTFSSAASTLQKCSSWSQVGTVNWGFTDGSSNAQTGFVKALAALTRPINDVLATFLVGKDLSISDVAIQVLSNINIDTTTTSGSYTVQVTLASNTLTIAFTNNDNPGSKTSTAVVDLTSVLNALSSLVIGGSNGYESAIIPIFEALNVDYKSYSAYLSDYSKAKDNLVIDILNPIVDFLNALTEAPIDTLTAALPSLAAFLENNGLGQAINNLLAPLTEIIDILYDNGIDLDAIIEQAAGQSLKDLLEDLIGIDLGDLNFKLTDLSNSLNIQDILIPLVNTLLKNNGINITLNDIDWSYLAGLSNQGQVLITVMRYLETTLIENASAINSLLRSIDAISSNSTIRSILDHVFGQIATAGDDDIVLAIFYLLLCEPTNSFFDYSGFVYKDYDFSYPTTVGTDFLTILGPMLDGLISGLIDGGLSGLVSESLYTDSIISSIATGLYGAVEGVEISDSMTLTELLAMTGIDFSTDGVADLLVDSDYGQTYSSAAKTIRNAGSWSRVNADSLSWGVTDRDSFVHALCAVLRPLYGVLDVLLNDGSLGLFNLIYLPGSDGYTSTIVPLLEALGCYNIKTQYQYRQDMADEYDYILIDILNPLLDKVEDILNAPIQTLTDMLPNLALFFANDGLLQIIDNLLTPITALLDAMQPIVDVNELLELLGLDIASELSSLGLVSSSYTFDIYNLSASLEPLIGSDNVVSLLNKVLGMIEINGVSLDLELMDIDWYQLASHGEVITDEASQASTYGGRIYVDADSNEVLIAVLRYLIDTINYKDNFSVVSNLISGLLGDVSDSVLEIIDTVLELLIGETDEVISDLCGLLETLA